MASKDRILPDSQLVNHNSQFVTISRQNSNYNNQNDDSDNKDDQDMDADITLLNNNKQHILQSK